MPEQKQQYEIGMVGLGVMGRNLVLNIADQCCECSGLMMPVG